MEFDVNYGMLQLKDINPAASGNSTPDLTNPRVDDGEDAKQEIITGQHAGKVSPILYIVMLAAVLFVCNLFQK